jgi:hypothetical protein
MDEEFNHRSSSHDSRQVNPPGGGTLEFITFTNPEMARSTTNQQRVRSQVMRDFHRRSGVPRRRRNEIELDITPLLERSAQATGTILAVEQSELYEPQRANEEMPLSLITSLGASRLDPFVQYPMRIGVRERELYCHRKWMIFVLGDS